MPMGRSGKDLRRSMAPLTGLPGSDDAALLRTAVPPEQPVPVAAKIKTQAAQLRSGYPKGLMR